jgi:hypothetical protein
MRRACLFIKHHLLDPGTRLPDQNRFFVGHDDLGADSEGNPNPGHGIGGGSWSQLSYGPKDLETALFCIEALEAMSEFEKVAPKLSPNQNQRPSIWDRKGAAQFTYDETSDTLKTLSVYIRRNAQKSFWNKETGRFAGGIGSGNSLIDYGNTVLNLQALAMGLADEGKGKQVLAWLDGKRTVPGDTVSGSDIYSFKFGPRVTTKENTTHYVWTRIEEVRQEGRKFGENVDNGGAVLWASYYDVLARLRRGGKDSAWERVNAVLDWYQDGRSEGDANVDETGTLPFRSMENGILPTAILCGFLGIYTDTPGELTISPNIPTGLDYLGVEHVAYQGNMLRIVERPGEIDLAGSKIAGPRKMRLRLVFSRGEMKNPVILKNGTPVSVSPDDSSNSVVFIDVDPEAVTYSLVDNDQIQPKPGKD